MHLIAGTSLEYVAVLGVCGGVNATGVRMSVEVFCMGRPNTQQTVVVSIGGVGCPDISAVVIPDESLPCSVFWVQWRLSSLPARGKQSSQFWVSGLDGTWAWPSGVSLVPSRRVVVPLHSLHGGSSLEWKIYPMTATCAPLAVESRLIPGCIPPSPLVWDWSADAPVWLLVTWTVGYGVYMLGIVSQGWASFPRIGLMYQSAILAVHLPLLVHVSFAWYVTATGAAACIPILYLAVTGLITMFRPKKTFRLSTARDWEGTSQLSVFLLFHLMVLGFAVDLER